MAISPQQFGLAAIHVVSLPQLWSLHRPGALFLVWASCFDTMCMKLFNNKTECQGNNKPLCIFSSSCGAACRPGSTQELWMNSSLWRETPDLFHCIPNDRRRGGPSVIRSAQFNSAVNVSDAQRCLSKRLFFFFSPKKTDRAAPGDERAKVTK